MSFHLIYIGAAPAEKDKLSPNPSQAAGSEPRPPPGLSRVRVNLFSEMEDVFVLCTTFDGTTASAGVAQRLPEPDICKTPNPETQNELAHALQRVARSELEKPQAAERDLCNSP